MKLIKTIKQVRKEVEEAKKKGKTVGFVPTMGYLHKGHISLVKKAKKESDYVVVSIFVNPTQFGEGEDYNVYPRDLNKDLTLLKKEKVDVVFNPEANEMYEKDFLTFVEVNGFSEKLEGKYRQGHFKGVCTVVLKLFNIVSPDRAYFGWKDAQQLIIIKEMVKDLNLQVKIIGIQTVREKDGLAASSRNIYLSTKERETAICLYKSLLKMKETVISKGIKNSGTVLAEGLKIIKKHHKVELQYLEAVDIGNLKPVKEIRKGVMIAGAIKIGKVKLIDNIVFK